MDIIPCIIIFSSPNIFTSHNTTSILKPANPLIIHLNKMLLVRTKLKLNKTDLYAIIKIENKDTFYEGIVIKYLDVIDISTLYTCNWVISNKINTYFLKTISNDNNIFFRQVCNKNLYSIDPPNCIDIDDAIHIFKCNNITEIGIHIADVSSYVNLLDDNINNELHNRINTFYSDTNIHMFPELLMKEMSLIDNNNYKRIISLIISFDENLNMIETSIKIQSAKIKNLSYDDIMILKNTNIDIFNIYDFGYKLNTKYKYFSSYDPHNMVAIYMIIANTHIAKLLTNYDKNNVLLRRQLNNNTNINPTNFINSNNLNDSLYKLLIQKHINTSLESSEYCIGSDNCFHSSMKLDLYTHFTSPIRRYVDIIVHTQILNYLKNEKLFTKFNIDKINIINKYYKQLNRYFKIYNIELTKTIYNAFIINVEYNNILLYIPELNIDVFLKPIHHELLSITNIIINNNILIINDKEYKMFDEIKINIIKYNNKFVLSL